MSYFDEVYKLRLNRYGLDYKSRVQGEREELFEKYLLKSIYRIDFTYNNMIHPAIFEKYKQDETKTLQYLLTRENLVIPNGTVLELPDKNNNYILTPWMVWYLEEIQASGYNKYIMLRMTHFVTWTNSLGETCQSWTYLYGQENNMLHNELKSRSRSDTIYTENLKSNFFIMPRNQYIRQDVYLEVGEEPYRESYRVTGYDLNSSPGVMYVTLDPIYKYDLTSPPIQQEGDRDSDFFWLNGGVDND